MTDTIYQALRDFLSLPWEWEAIAGAGAWAAVFVSLYLANRASRQASRVEREQARVVRAQTVLQLKKLYENLSLPIQLHDLALKQNSKVDVPSSLILNPNAVDAIRQLEALSSQFHLLTSYEFNTAFTVCADTFPVIGFPIEVERARKMLAQIQAARDVLLKNPIARRNPLWVRLLASFAPFTGGAREGKMTETQKQIRTIKIYKFNGMLGYIHYVGKDQKYFTEFEGMTCFKLIGDEEIEDTGRTATLEWEDPL